MKIEISRTAIRKKGCVYKSKMDKEGKIKRIKKGKNEKITRKKKKLC